jgi:hypothetical protein
VKQDATLGPVEVGMLLGADAVLLTAYAVTHFAEQFGATDGSGPCGWASERCYQALWQGISVASFR